jgi:hypothetical protein
VDRSRQELLSNADTAQHSNAERLCRVFGSRCVRFSFAETLEQVSVESAYTVTGLVSGGREKFVFLGRFHIDFKHTGIYTALSLP